MIAPAPLSLASFFTIEARSYEHIPFNSESALLARNIILALCIGIVLACLCTFYQKYVPGKLIRALLRAEADTPETAKTPEELGLARNIFLRAEFRFGTMLLKHLRIVPEEQSDGAAESSQKRVDFSTARLYIPEELRYRAEAHYDTKGNGPIQLVFTVLLSAVIAVVLIKLLPILLSLLDSIL